ncbi:MAG: DsbA family protein [Myxococcota bacterium]
MSRSAWLFTLTSVLALGVAAPGCIGKRRPQGRTAKKEQPSLEPAKLARLIQPQDVDGSFDASIEGDRQLATYDEQDPQKGAALPLVTIVEYSDFQCPYCSRLAATMDEVVDGYPQDVKLVFKQFPLPMHAQAEPAARASLAAQAQGKFWPMHDLLFANPKAMSDRQLEDYARQIGLDVDQWKTDFANEETAKHVEAEKVQGTPLGVRGTPSFFINGKFYSGAMGAPQLRSMIDGEILAAKALLKAGAKREELYARFLHPAAAKAAGAPAAGE